MPGPTETFWRLVPDIYTRERSRFLFFVGLFALGNMALTVGLVGSEALFLARFGAARLPEIFIAASVVTMLGSFVYGASVGRARNDRLLVGMTAGAAILLLAAAFGLGRAEVWIVPALFCLYYVVQVVFQNHFFTFAGDYFDTPTAKRLFPRFAIGASLGSGVGGLVAALLAEAVGPRALVVAWGLLLAAAALLLQLGRRALRRWGPLELEEADETSVEGILGAVRYLSASPFGRYLVLSAVGMVAALFVAQYLYSDLFARRFPDRSDLAAFLGVYLAVTNLIEIAIGLWVTPRVIRRFGVPSANLIHPLLTLLSFGGLGLQYRIETAVAARMNRELLENAMAFPIRALVLNAMPLRLRGRVRAFLEGVVVNAGMAGAGLLLLGLGRPEPIWLCLLGGGAALVFLGSNLRVRREYLRTLIDELRAGRLDLAEVGAEIGSWEASRLAELWEELLADAGARPSQPLFDLMPILAARGVTGPLVRAASHPNPEVRRSCVSALAAVADGDPEGPLGLALDDPDAGVRLAALRGLIGIGSDTAFLAPRLRDLLADPSPTLRAEAAACCGDEGQRVLRAMIDSGDPPVVAAALGVATPAFADAAKARVRDREPQIRAAALACAVRIGSEAPLPVEELRALLADPDARVRRAVVTLLARFGGTDAGALLAGALADASASVQAAAETALLGLGEPGIQAVEIRLRSDCERSVAGALRVLAASGSALSLDLLRSELRRRARELWYDLVAFQLLPVDTGPAGLFLRAAYQDAMMRNRRVAFRVLELLEDATVIRRVEKGLRLGSARSYGNALEVLSNLGDRHAAQLLVLMHERAPLDERLRAARAIASLPTRTREVLDASRHSERRWIRLAAEAVDAPEGIGAHEEELMERLLALRQIPLFAQLSLEQLEAVNRVAKEAVFLPDEVIVKEGDPGGELYLLIEGSVRVVKHYGTPNETELGSMTAGSYFGEMAVLDDASRSATILASNRLRLLSVDGGSIKELILEMPEIAFEIFRVLTQRVRAAEARLGDR
ncbi:MAG: cyclic nucleotide-binding domain-containing protein [Myxococcales bacterium]|nr:cyclic nucleotide-binding domain-containing protein [Myxococcales bacterium]